MNIKRDILVTPENLDKGLHFNQLLKIAVEGSEDQRDVLLTWGYRELPAFVWEHLVNASGRGHLLT